MTAGDGRGGRLHLKKEELGNAELYHNTQRNTGFNFEIPRGKLNHFLYIQRLKSIYFISTLKKLNVLNV